MRRKNGPFRNVLPKARRGGEVAALDFISLRSRMPAAAINRAAAAKTPYSTPMKAYPSRLVGNRPTRAGVIAAPTMKAGTPSTMRKAVRLARSS